MPEKIHKNFTAALKLYYYLSENILANNSTHQVILTLSRILTMTNLENKEVLTLDQFLFHLI